MAYNLSDNSDGDIGKAETIRRERLDRGGDANLMLEAADDRRAMGWAMSTYSAVMSMM